MVNGIKRKAYYLLEKKLEKNKVLLIYGARRTGKTSLLKEFEKNTNEKILFLNGESLSVQDEFEKNNIESIKSFIGNNSILIIDEAQEIQNIGSILKIIVDEIPNLKVIASGSASFDLAQKTGEPLTGRKKTILMYPISIGEIVKTFGQLYQKESLENQLIFGMYPEIFSLAKEEKKEYLEELVNSYLFKDILKIDKVKNPKKLRDLLVLLAFQIGKEVSLAELGTQLGINKITVSRYLDLLEKTFVIKNIRGFSRNLRKEVSKTSRYYFFDNGIRNALIRNFAPLNLRNDVGMLWENFIVIERLKTQSYNNIFANNYFWRTYQGNEIDLIEEIDGKINAFEMKFSAKKVKEPVLFLKTYPDTDFFVINKDNYLNFLI